MKYTAVMLGSIETTLMVLKVTGAIEWSWLQVFLPVTAAMTYMALCWLFGFVLGMTGLFND